MIFVRFVFLCWAIVLSLTFAGSAQNRDNAASAGEIRNDETAREASVKLWKKSFDMVWESVKLFCFDENVCGKNWDDLKQKYEPRVALVKNDNELHILLQTMLNELNTSHLRIIPIAAEEVLQRHHWGIGAETEIIDSRLTIKKVYPDSPAEKAKLRPGFVITKINDRSVEQIIDEYKNNPLWAGKNWRNTVRDLIYVYYLAGTENAGVSIEFLDEKDISRQAALVRSFKNPVPKEIEYKMLEGGAGYIKLNVFNPSAMPEFCKAVRSMNEAPAIILDLRDNPGGTTAMSESVLGLLDSKPVKLGRFFKVTSEENPYLSSDEILESYPQARPFTGKLVVLINNASGSTSEILAAGLQESGRAVIVGEQSIGEVMPSQLFRLPTPALFLVAVSEFETAGGVRLEGKGVTPDITVSNGRKSLLDNTDHQLQTAVNLITDGKIFKEIKARNKQTNTVIKTADKTASAQKELLLAPDSKAEGVFDRYIMALGGKAAIEKLNSRVMSGTVKNSITGAGGKFVMYDKMPGKYMLIVHYEDGTIVQEGFNGTDFWKFHSLFGFKKYQGDALSRVGGLSEFTPALNPMLVFKQRYAQTVLAGEETLTGSKDAFKILAIGNRDDLTDLYSFDRQTGLLIEKGSYRFDDYRTVDNVQIPHSIKVPGVISYSVLQVTHNTDIAEDVFDKPVPNCFMLTDK